MSGIYEQLKDDLGYLQLGHAAETFATLAETARQQDWTHLQFLARLIGDQANATRDRRMAARLRYARFPFRRTLDEFDYDFQPSVDRKLVDDLATLRFVDEARPVLFLGQPGCGKTHLAVALAIRVVEAGWRGYFTTADDMTRTLVRAQIEGTWTAKLKTYTAPTVLVIDDVGLLPIADRDAVGRVLPRRQHPLRETSPHDRDHQPGAARLGTNLGHLNNVWVGFDVTSRAGVAG